MEQAIEPELPSAKTKIADVSEASQLLKQLQKEKTYLLHLAEGTQESANKHFRALQLADKSWAITGHLAGIHATGLLPADMKIMAKHGGKIIWSPMSNLLLYGVTTDVQSAKDEGILLSLGSDWSASGSKNLLNELKVAKLFSDAKGGIFTDEELVRMVTVNPAITLQWENHCGSIESGKKADLLILKGQTKEAYRHFISAREKDVSWVIIDGIPRFGTTRLMKKFLNRKEKILLNGSERLLYLGLSGQINPIDLKINYKQAKKLLTKGLRDLPTLATAVESRDSAFALGSSSNPASGFDLDSKWIIEADHSDHGDVCGRHHIRLNGERTTIEDGYVEAADPLSEILEPMLLDESNVEDDKWYFKRLATQINLPEYLKLELPTFYGQTISLSDSENYRAKILQEQASELKQIRKLPSFLNAPGYLTLHEKISIIDQAEVILDKAYVHLIQKNALYGSNPVDKLRVLRNELLNNEEQRPEIAFHRNIIEIFNSLRDLHTVYQLPDPYASKVAFLPFFIEKYFEENIPRFVVSKIIGKQPSRSFTKGVEVTHWNGTPIQNAIAINGRKYSGSNEIARLARGLDSLTFRPLSVMLPPEEEWITITYHTTNGKVLNKRFPWRVGSMAYLLKERAELQQAEGSVMDYAHGYDYLSEVVQGMKKTFFARAVSPREAALHKKGYKRPGKDFLPTTLPFLFKAKKLKRKKNRVGYIRIYSFKHSSAEEMATEFQRLLSTFGTNNIIVDIRNNPGGSILAAEFILQTLTKKDITPQSAQFVNSDLTNYVCDNHSPSQVFEGLDLSRWARALRSIRNTGAEYSVAYPITPKKIMKTFKSGKDYRCILITDALCYSASDIFAAGFQDYGVGRILGIDENTGAGGANVWSLSQLYGLTKDPEGQSQFFKPLPYGADFRVAIRRTLRSGTNAGIPLEDLGVIPDESHLLTKDDLLHQNVHLIEKAMAMLESD